MLGIPTRSDAMEICEDYDSAIKAEMLYDKLDDFRGVFSTVFPHNHVAEAYDDSGNIKLFPSSLYNFRPPNLLPPLKFIRGVLYELGFSVPSNFPKDVDELLMPELVRSHYIEAADLLLLAVEKARSLLDRDIVHEFTHGDDAPYSDLYDLVHIERCTTDYVVDESEDGPTMVYSEGKGKGWKYSYNLYEMLRRTLTNFSDLIIAACWDQPVKIEKIVSMMMIAEVFSNSDNVRLLHLDLMSGPPIEVDTYMMERVWNGPVHELERQHEKAADHSTMSIRFDEAFFEIGLACARAINRRSTLMLPAEYLLDKGARFSVHALSTRNHARFLLNQALDATGGIVVINGVTYQRAISPVDGSLQNCFFTNGPAFQVFVNLLNNPVIQPDGTVMMPEEWAYVENLLVDAYHAGIAHAATNLIEIYDCDYSSGHPTVEKRMERLRYYLRDWDEKVFIG